MRGKEEHLGWTNRPRKKRAGRTVKKKKFYPRDGSTFFSGGEVPSENRGLSQRKSHLQRGGMGSLLG